MDVATRADAEADSFLASLGVELSPGEAAMLRNAYIVGWIERHYADVATPCPRRRYRRPATCQYNARPWRVEQ